MVYVVLYEERPFREVFIGFLEGVSGCKEGGEDKADGDEGCEVGYEVGYDASDSIDHGRL